MLIQAPLGYKLVQKIHSDNEEEVMNLCLNLSDDENYKRHVYEDSHQERLDMLKENGFIVDESDE